MYANYVIFMNHYVQIHFKKYLREDRNLLPCMIYLVLQYLRENLHEFDF